jgi:L-ascorbate metabolism protein UlaG (beta-lactamase superfamily)
VAITLTYYGHAALGLDISGTHVLVDPFIGDNPTATADPAELPADFILVSHGHVDHVGDTVDIAKRTGATVVTNLEMSNWFVSQGLERVHPQHIGGGYRHPFGYLKLTLALHGSGLPDGSYGGNPCGFLLETEEERLYLACDTGLFGDMALIGADGVDLAVLPIGDNFTMGPKDALRAVAMIKPRMVVPVHYNTWELIAQDAQAWKREVEALSDTKVYPLSPGERLKIDQVHTQEI